MARLLVARILPARVLAVVLLTACATPYQAKGLTGGFSDTRLDTNTFRVDFRGNGFTSRARVEVYLLRRAAELTLEHGYDYFVVVDGETERKISTVTTPGQYTATTTGSAYRVGSTAYGTATTMGTYTPGVTVPITKYGASSVIQAFRGEKPAGLARAFDARNVLQYAGGSGGARQDLKPVAVTASPAPSEPLPVPPTTASDEVLTNESILAMVKADLDEAVILAKITASPARFDTRTEALIELKRAGVPDRVLAAMVEKR